MKTFVISYIVWLALAAGGIVLWRTSSDPGGAEPARRTVASTPQAAPSSLSLEQRLRQALSGSTDRRLLEDSLFTLVDEADLVPVVKAAASCKNRKEDYAALSALLARWFELDRDGAFLFILKMDPETAGSFATALLSNWADSDSVACRTWVRGSGAGLVQAALGNHETLAARDRGLFALLEPGECMKKAVALQKSERSESGKLIYAMARWQKDAPARRAFLDELSQNHLSSGWAFNYWATFGVTGLEDLLPPQSDDDTLGSFSRVVGAAINTGPGSPEAAAAWRMSTAGETETKQATFHQIVSAWMDSGKDGLDAWISALPEPADRDAAERAAAMYMIPVDSRAAVAYAERIREPGLRLGTLYKAVRAWQGEDPLAAAAFLSRAGWPEEVKDTLALMCLCPPVR